MDQGLPTCGIASAPECGREAALAEVLAPKVKSSVNVRWIDLFRYPQVSGLVFAKFLSDAAWYFYIFWLPKYLYDVHHFDTKQVGYFAWIPYAAAGVGSLLGGWFSSRLIQRGFSLNMSRKIALGVSAGVMPSILLVMHSPVQFVIVLFSIAFAGQQSWSTLVMTLPSDLFPRALWVLCRDWWALAARWAASSSALWWESCSTSDLATVRCSLASASCM